MAVKWLLLLLLCIARYKECKGDMKTSRSQCLISLISSVLKDQYMCAAVGVLLVSFVCCCVTRYLGYRHSPWLHNKYAYTMQFWHVIAARFVFIVCFEVCHFRTLCDTLFLCWNSC